ncbi:MAG: glycosyltransferase family 1 protein, partial [Nocardioidaceae bacterium]|nr:glycosyltransferase family 1 protein [Nocardioidaceae bacterium]
MRILHVTDHYPPVTGGIESHVAALATRQALRGHDVTVLTSTPRRAEGRVSADDGPVTVVRARSLLDGRRTDVRDTDLVHAHLSVVAPFTAPVV